jgi:hypothetical protein
MNRQRLSIAVLIVAALASLATSPGPPFVDDTAVGEVEIGPSTSEMHVVVALTGVEPSVPTYTTSENRLDFSSRGISPSSVEVQLVRVGSEEPEPVWTHLPATTDIPLDQCTGSCSIEYTIRLRVSDPAVTGLVLQWRLYAMAFGSADQLNLEVTVATPGPNLVDAATAAAVGGMAIGLLLALLAAVRIGRRSRLAMLELVGALVLVVGGIVVFAGALPGLATGAVGFLFVLGGSAALIGISRRRPILSRPGSWLIPIGLVTIPAAAARFATAGEFREIDVVIAFGSGGIATVAALVLTASRWRDALKRLSMASTRLWAAIGLAAILVIVSGAWTFIVALQLTYLSPLVALPFGAVCLGTILALTRWLEGDAITPFVVGLLTPVLAGLAGGGFLMSTVSQLFTERDPLPLLVESLFAVAVGGAMFAVLTVVPPAHRDKSISGRALQHGWDQSERPVPDEPWLPVSPAG